MGLSFIFDDNDVGDEEDIVITGQPLGAMGITYFF